MRVKDAKGRVNKINACQDLIKELFDPEDATNVKTTQFMPKIAKMTSKAFLKEMHDKKKTTYQHLSSQNGELSWANASQADKDNSMNVASTNDVCESTSGVLTDEIKTHDDAKLTHAGGIAACRKNGDFNSGFKKIGKDGV